MGIVFVNERKFRERTKFSAKDRFLKRPKKMNDWKSERFWKKIGFFLKEQFFEQTFYKTKVLSLNITNDKQTKQTKSKAPISREEV